MPGGIPQLPGGGLHAGAQAYDPSAGNALTKLADSHKIVETTHKPLKDFKDAKIEWKEQKPERKESKDLKDHVEVYQTWPHIPIPDPGPYNPGKIAIGQLSPFISSDLRPDLTCGALRQETDLQGVDFASLSTQLQKEAANAMQAKVEFDTQQPQG